MIKGTARIQNKLGLHARAASSFVTIAQGFSSTITVLKGVTSANGKSIMNMMLLQAGIDSEIEINVEGEDETEAMSALLALVNSKFGEPE